MTVSKSILSMASIATVLLFGGGVYVMMNLGSIAKNITERIASDTMGVSVNIGKMDIDLPNKTVLVSNLKIGNPAGYKKSHAATIETIRLKAQTISDVLLRFNDISVSGSEVYLEVKENRTNLTDIQKTVNSKAAKGDKAAQQIKVIIENMKIEKLRVNPSVLLIGDQDLEPIVVPDIVLRGVGVKENGVLAREAIGQVWTAISKKVNASAAQNGFYQGMNEEALKDIGATQFQQFKQQLDEDIDKLGDDLKTLFGN